MAALLYYSILLSIYLQKTLIVRSMGLTHTQEKTKYSIVEQNIINLENWKHVEEIQKFYDDRQDWYTSNLGTLMFKKPDHSLIESLTETQQIFTVYILSKTSILLTGEDLLSINQSKLFESCGVRNCVFTRDKLFRAKADAVLVNIIDDDVLVSTIENNTLNQIRILYSLVSPLHLYKNFQDRTHKLKKYANLFNWTMTYRTDANIPVPYGRVVPLMTPVMVNISNANQALFQLVPNWSQKSHDVLLAIIIDDCKMSRQMNFLNKLNHYMKVDIYGNCSFTNKPQKNCPGGLSTDCPFIENYLFYVVLEPVRCLQYFTEKIYYFAYAKGAIPVIWGAQFDDCHKHLPPNSYINAENYTTFKHLVRHINRISKNNIDLLHYHKWRKHYRVSNEHGYFGTNAMQMCRLCEALNYNDITHQTYNFEELSIFFDPYETCW